MSMSADRMVGMAIGRGADAVGFPVLTVGDRDLIESTLQIVAFRFDCGSAQFSEVCAYGTAVKAIRKPTP